MATVTKTIKSGGDYSTPAAWENDLDDSSIYSSGDTAIGEVSGDHELTAELLINGGGTVGLTQTRLTVPTADRHDGTAGSGVRFTFDMTGTRVLKLAYATADVQRTVEWIEWDFEQVSRSGDEWMYLSTFGADTSDGRLINLSHCLIHGPRGSSHTRIIVAESFNNSVHNNIMYDVQGGGPYNRGIWMSNNRFLCAANTVYGVSASGSGSNAAGIYTQDSTYSYLWNNVVCGTSGTGAKDFQPASSYGWFGDGGNNLSSDTTAPDSDSIHSESASDLFVSTTSGSEDLHLKAGAAAIGAGADLGTGYYDSASGFTLATSTFGTSLNYDIDNYDREAAEDWDIGADQRVAAAASALPVAMNTYQQMMRGS